MLKSTKKNYGVESIDNWKGKMMWRTLEKCWKCQGFCGDGEEGKSKVSPRNHCQGRHWNYTKEEWNKKDSRRRSHCTKSLEDLNMFEN